MFTFKNNFSSITKKGGGGGGGEDPTTYSRESFEIFTLYEATLSFKQNKMLLEREQQQR